MRVFLTGGTGLIGRNLVRRLLARGDQPVVLTRQADKVRREPAMRPVQFVQGDPSVSGGWETAVDGCDAVVNLVGHNLFQDRWTAEVKRKIRDTRVYATEHVVAAIEKARSRPTVLVQASAIGYYGPHADDTALTEQSPSGNDFMAVVCREWEEAAAPATALGLRLAVIRTGIVLAKDEGALKIMTPIFKVLGGAPVGGHDNPLKPGNGNQWMSWVHVDDIAGLFLLPLDNPNATGPINGVSPNPVRNADFGRALAKTLWRWFVPIGPPNILMNLILGEVAQVVTTGQKVMPEAAKRLGFQFKFPEVRGALADLYARKPPVEVLKPATRPTAAHH